MPVIQKNKSMVIARTEAKQVSFCENEFSEWCQRWKLNTGLSISPSHYRTDPFIHLNMRIINNAGDVYVKGLKCANNNEGFTM